MNAETTPAPVKSPGPRRSRVERESPFYVPPFLDVLGRLTSRFPAAWLWFGDLESSVLAPQLAAVAIDAPIFICGLARSGSTLLHEVVCAHPGVATHRQKDFPFVSTPYWWRRATAKVGPSPARERPHRDRMLVTSESPDAVEEMLWMAFFPHAHDPQRDNRLHGHDGNPAFESYYRNHIRKLVLAESAARYAAKANYHVARLAYLIRLFPDARFVIPVRSPAGHIASLARQHAWFSAGQRRSPRSLAYMQRSGHFEFGLDRRPLNLGDGDRVVRIQEAWRTGQEVRGWARYWDMVYRYLADLLESETAVRKAALVVPFEELCARPEEVLARVLAHVRLSDARPILDRYVPTIRPPDYYTSPFATADLAIIREETAATASRLGVE